MCALANSRRSTQPSWLRKRTVLVLAAWASAGCVSGLDFDDTTQSTTENDGSDDAGSTDDHGTTDGTTPVDPGAPRDDGGTNAFDASAGPTIVGTIPTAGASDVAPDTKVTITFDRDISAGVGAIMLVEALSQSEVESAPIEDDRITIDGDSLVVDWDTTLSTATGYYVTLTPGAVEDLDGNPFIGIRFAEQLAFNTRAPRQLALSSTVPGDGALDVPRTGSLRFTFNEPVVAGLEGNITLFDTDKMETFEVIPISDELRAAIEDTRLTISPSGVFSYGTRYQVSIDPGAVQSTEGAALESELGGLTFAFTTVQPPPLELIGTVPADNATAVDPATSLVLTFAEPIEPGEGTLSLHRADDDSIVEIVSMGDANVVVSGVTLTVDWTAELDTSTEYYFTVETGVAISELGAAFEGISDPSRLSFTTGGSIVPPLDVLVSSPRPGGEDIALGASLTLVFSADVQVGSGVVSVFSYDDEELIETIDVAATTQVAVSGDTANVQLTSPLKGSTKYYVTVSAGSFQDSRGASFAGITDKDAWSFNTEIVFGLANVQPSDDASGVNPSTNLVMTFTDPISIGAGDIELRAVVDDSLIETIPIDSSQVSLDGTTITVDLDSILGSETAYYVDVDSSALVADTGESWDGIKTKTRWNFTTDVVDFPAGTGSGLVLWLDAAHAESIKSSSNGVSLWADRSGKYRNVRQGIGAARPERTTGAIGGKAAVRFDGDDQLEAAGIDLVAYDAFIVWQSPQTAGFGDKKALIANDRNMEVTHSHPWDGAINAASSCVGPDCPNDGGWYSVRFTPAPAANTPHLWNWGFDAITTNIYARANGSAPVNNTGPTMTPWRPESPLLIGNCTTPPCGFTGDIGEIVIYSRTLSPDERSNVVSYLRNKWSLSAPNCDSSEELGPSGSCYYLGTNTVDWATARSTCQARGRGWDLATVRSATDHGFASSLLQNDTFIGATDSAVDGTWRWVTDTLQFWSGDSSGSAVNSAFSVWAPDEPSNLPGEHCARYSLVGSDWVWRDVSCDGQYQYLCEGPAN